MKNYILRVYRDEKDHPRSLIGIVETVGMKGRKAFTNIDELWGILNPRKKGVKRGKNIKESVGE